MQNQDRPPVGDGGGQGGESLPLAIRPEWSDVYAEIHEVEPLLSATRSERSAFLKAIGTARREEDLSYEHRRMLREGQANIDARRASRAAKQ